MRIVTVLGLAALLAGCATTQERAARKAAKAEKQRQEDAQREERKRASMPIEAPTDAAVAHCRFLGTITESSSWGQGSAMIDAARKAKSQGATHYVRGDAQNVPWVGARAHVRSYQCSVTVPGIVQPTGVMLQPVD